MKTIDMRKQDTKQFYVLPTIIISKNYLGRKVFLVWLNWCIQL
jgi:hypothetical protein